MVLSRSFTDHHIRCGGWLNFEFSKRGKHLGWAIETIYKKQSRCMLKHIPLDPRLNSSGVLDETTEKGRLFQTGIVLEKNEFFRASL